MDKLSRLSWLIIFLCELFVITFDAFSFANVHRLQQGIAQNVIRFHVRANSDSEEDQNLKMQVKKEVVAYIGSLTQKAGSKEDAYQIISESIPDIEKVATEVIKQNQKEYNVKAYFEESYFPVKEYANLIFPAGEYEAFRIDIGDAKGKNWWCVIYPGLCFVDESLVYSTEEAIDELELVLDEDELELITQGSDNRKGCGVKKVYFSHESGIIKLIKNIFR